MKLNLLFPFYFACLALFSCTQPIGTSLLVDPKNNCSTFSTCNAATATDATGLEISSSLITGSTIVLPMEESDRVEVTGTCKDLGRKDNRILVQAFAGEDVAADPYVDNTISDHCYPSTNSLRTGLESAFISPKSLLMGVSQSFTFTASGGVAPYTYALVLGTGAIDPGTGVFTSAATGGTTIVQAVDATGEGSRAIITVLSGLTTSVATLDNGKCFGVTKGIGRVEDAGLPNERTFPQCHDGQFGFSVRLGKVLMNASAGQPNNKYTVRFKLRTQDGTISDSAWTSITVERGLATPVISSAVHADPTHKCTIVTNAARFNPGILYTLNRTYTDILATSVGSTNLFTNANSLSTTVGTSVMNWDDIGLVDGVTYNYTLSSTDASFAYSPTPPASVSTVVTCQTKRIYIQMSATPTTNTCYFGLSSSTVAGEATTFNPYVTYEWGYVAGNASWIGDGKINAGYTSATCGNTAVCTEAGLTTNTTYYFALRAKNTVTGEIGLWSLPIACKTQ